MNIIIRKVELTDAKAIKEIYECKNAHNGTLQLPHPSLTLWEKRLSNIPDNVYNYVLIINNEIGFELATNARRRHVAYFGMGVKDNVQG